MKHELRVLMVTSEWPTPENPEWAAFLVQQVKSLQEAGLQVDVYPFRGQANPLKYLQSHRQLRRKFDLSRYDLIHAQFGQSALLCLPKRSPLVVTFHGSDLHGIVGQDGSYTLRGKILRYLSQLVARQATQVILVSGHLAGYLPVGIHPHIIPCGVDLQKFQPIDKREARKKLGLESDKSLILFVADPNNPIKRYQLAKNAVESVPLTYQAELVVLSGIPHDEVPLYMNACDCLIVTSLHEGSPTVVKEALACDLPVVSVNVGDVAERLTGLEGCVLCGDDSIGTISKAIAQILDNPDSFNGRYAVAQFDESMIAEKVIDIYQSALSSWN